MVLAGPLFAFLVAQTFRQQWSSDMWGVHVATVREQIAHLTNPHNPLLVANDPFPYFSPYTTAVAGVAKVVGIGPIGALQLAAIANALLFLCAFERFVTRLMGDTRVAFYALIFTLLLWGFSPFRGSGFLDLNSIGFVLPYPSMFAVAMALVALGSLVVYLRTGSRWELLVLTIAASLVLITHPLTASWVAVVAVALVVSSSGNLGPRRLFGLAAAAAVVAGVAVAWPLYSVLSLRGNGGVFDAINSWQYSNPLLRTFLALPGLWFVWHRSRRNWRDPLGLILVGALSLYLVGWLSNNREFGRALVPAMLALHLALAAEAVSIEKAIRSRPRMSARNGAIVALASAGLLMGFVGAATGVAHVLPTALRSKTSLDDVPGQFRFLHVVPTNAVVVAQPGTLASLAEPAFGGKLLSSGEPLPAGRTTTVDRATTRQFFARDTSADVLLELIRRYDIEYVVASRATAIRLATRSSANIVGCSSKWSVIATTEGHPQDGSCYAVRR